MLGRRERHGRRARRAAGPSTSLSGRPTGPVFASSSKTARTSATFSRSRPGSTPSLTAPSGEFAGDFSDTGAFTGGIANPFIAQVLDGRPGCDAALGYTVASLGPNPAWGGTGGVFPNNVIPAPCQDPVASNLMQQFIPAANVNGNNVSVPVSTDNEDQFTVRFDHKINDAQNFSAYYYFNDGRQLQPFDQFEAAGANVPGFGNLNNSRFQQYNLAHTWTVSNSVVNEARFTYMREGQLGFLTPQSTGAVTSSCTSAVAVNCFTGTSDSTAITSLYGTSPKLGITPGLPSSLTGVPYINISGGAVIGNNFEGTLPQVGNSFQWSDNLTWVKGNHTMKFGVDVRRARFDQYYYFDVNGEFTFDNSGPNAIVPGDGDNYAEFLLRSDRYLHARVGSAGRYSGHVGLSVRARQLEDQAQRDAELWSALGA